MLFSELFKIMVNEVTFVGFRWGDRDRPNRSPLDPPPDAMQMDVHKTLYSFYLISLCWLNLNSQSFV